NVMAALRALVAAVAVDGMVGGQYFDVTSSGDLDGPALRRLHELKTGRLIGASIDCVLLVAGSDPHSTLPFRRFAAELGVLFQIVDDILDVIGDEATLGKPPRSDERHGKSTYVSVYGLDHARELASCSHAKARDALAEVDGRTETLEQITDYILTRPT
nr:polyprenyl synthetase family protein [Thermoleophilaceae bacterium]